MKRLFPCALIAVAAIWCLSDATYGQTSYSDVAVIVNVNSDASQTIGSYFKSHRNIPKDAGSGRDVSLLDVRDRFAA